MRHPWRMVLFGVGAIGLGALYLAGCAAIAAPAERPSRYASLMNHLALTERGVTDVVTAVNFDLRGFDTLGEEFILFVSVMGALVLLRESGEKNGRVDQDAGGRRRKLPHSEAVRFWTLGMTGPTIIFGLYMVAHGQITPGGGFQGGVVLATAPLLVYLASDFKTFKRVVSYPLVEAAEAAGAAGFALIGFLAWLRGGEFLTNVLPLGQSQTLLSGGAILAINYAVGLEVAAGFSLLLYAFLQSTLTPQRKKS